MIVFAHFANFTSVLTEHHGVIGMSGRNALSIYMLHLCGQQPLHTRVDIVHARGGLTAIPLAKVQWGGMAVASAVKLLKEDWQTNQFLASYAADACQGMLATTMSDCAISMLQQPRTPINLVAVKIMMLALFEAFSEENRTFTALQNGMTKTLQQPCFERSTLCDDLNPDGLALNAVDGASGGKTCNGRFGVLHFCPASNRQGTPLPPDVSRVPPAPLLRVWSREPRRCAPRADAPVGHRAPRPCATGTRTRARAAGATRAGSHMLHRLSPPPFPQLRPPPEVALYYSSLV